MPVPPAATDPAAPPPPVVAQTAPEPVTPPPPPPTAPPAQAVSAAPAPGYVVAPPPPSYGGLAPQLKGLSVWGILPYAYYSSTGLGIGGRFMLPLALPSLLKNTNVRDGFALEFGADYLHWSVGAGFGDDISVNWFLPTVGIMWNVWLNDKLVLYPKFSLGYYYAWVSGLPDGYGGYGSSIYWDIDLGAMYKLDSGLTVRAELGYSGLKVGVGWLF